MDYGIWAMLADSVFKVKICDIDHLARDLEKHGQSSPRLIYQIQCAPSGTECDIVFKLMAKKLN